MYPTALLGFLARLPDWSQTLVGIVILIAAAALANMVVKRLILRSFERVLDSTSLVVRGDELDPIVRRLANIVPAIVISQGARLVPHLPADVITVTGNVVSAFIVLTIALAISTTLDLANALYQHRPDAASRPIKGYIQVMKIALFAGVAILIAALLMEQSPLLLLSGLGAMAAVLMLVFKDTILSLVASVQLTSNDMLRVGDWIEMPKHDANGDVIDIALHTVKVQNWDKTITTIPTYRMISDSYRNWRGMAESGGRRIMRSLYLDQNSVRFLTDARKSALRRLSLLEPYLDAKQEELDSWNAKLVKWGRASINQRALTNIGTFRAYVQAYLEAHPQIQREMTLLVRQLQPGAEGIPIEIYCFTATTAWSEYEGIQADIFDHLLAILPYFELRLFQKPSGMDVRELPFLDRQDTREHLYDAG